MKSIRAVLLFLLLLAGTGLALQGCALLAAPEASAIIGGAQLAIKGVELEDEIRKADAQEAIDRPFQEMWGATVLALANLYVEISQINETREGDGGIIEGRVKNIKVKVVAVKLTEGITEIGVWAGHNKALAGLIAERIKEKARKRE